METNLSRFFFFFFSLSICYTIKACLSLSSSTYYPHSIATLMSSVNEAVLHRPWKLHRVFFSSQNFTQFCLPSSGDISINLFPNGTAQINAQEVQNNTIWEFKRGGPLSKTATLIIETEPQFIITKSLVEGEEGKRKSLFFKFLKILEIQKLNEKNIYKNGDEYVHYNIILHRKWWDILDIFSTPKAIKMLDKRYNSYIKSVESDYNSSQNDLYINKKDEKNYSKSNNLYKKSSKNDAYTNQKNTKSTQNNIYKKNKFKKNTHVTAKRVYTQKKQPLIISYELPLHTGKFIPGTLSFDTYKYGKIYIFTNKYLPWTKKHIGNFTISPFTLKPIVDSQL